jgi:hypothetical protein
MGISSYLSKFALGITPEGLLSPPYGGTGTTTGGGGGNSPTITSIAYIGDDTATNITGGDTVTINGTNFNTGVTVLVGDVQVSQVSFVSSTQLTFIAPANAAGSYILYVVNTDGGVAISVSGIQYSGVPAWTTSAGSLGTPNASTSFTTTIAATGDAPISYSVVSGALPAGINLNSSTGVISGTTPNISTSTTYNFTIRASDAQNQDTSRAFSLGVIAVPLAPSIIGEAWGGGYYGGKISTSGNGVATHYLIVAPKSTEVFGKTFTSGTANNASSDIDGPTNTANHASQGSNAAQYCQDLVFGGYSDWYLPAKNELEVLYYFLKPSTDENGTGYQAGGPNANAVSPEPLNTAYTSTAPSQTTAIAFRKGGGQHFEPSSGTPNYPYWCSTDHWSDARVQRFDAGQQEVYPRGLGAWTRAVRRIPV